MVPCGFSWLTTLFLFWGSEELGGELKESHSRGIILRLAILHSCIHECNRLFRKKIHARLFIIYFLWSMEIFAQKFVTCRNKLCIPKFRTIRNYIKTLRHAARGRHSTGTKNVIWLREGNRTFEASTTWEETNG